MTDCDGNTEKILSAQRAKNTTVMRPFRQKPGKENFCERMLFILIHFKPKIPKSWSLTRPLLLRRNKTPRITSEKIIIVEIVQSFNRKRLREFENVTMEKTLVQSSIQFRETRLIWIEFYVALSGSLTVPISLIAGLLGEYESSGLCERSQGDK